MLLLVGCTVVPPQPVLAPVASAVNAVQLEQQKLQRQLLANARLALSRDRLMKPTGDNAFFWYQQVLEMDELNEAAHNGMRRVTARYLALAKESFQKGQYDRAQRMLDGAAKISASPSVIEYLRKRYQPPAAGANEFRLAIADLDARNEQLNIQLKSIADIAKESESRILIVARNDSEGRWLYRQMRSTVEGYRLRGNIQLGKLPRVVLIDLPK